MDKNKIAEFISVFISGVILAGLIMLTFYYLKGITQILVLAVILAITIASLQYLRKRFGRNQ